MTIIFLEDLKSVAPVCEKIHNLVSRHASEDMSKVRKRVSQDHKVQFLTHSILPESEIDLKFLYMLHNILPRDDIDHKVSNKIHGILPRSDCVFIRLVRKRRQLLLVTDILYIRRTAASRRHVM